MNEITTIAAQVTCHTADCENGGITIEVQMAEGGAVICGPCAQPITDVVPVGSN